MNSAINSKRLGRCGGVMAVMALVLGVSVPALAQTAPAFSEAPTPSVAPLATPNADTPESYVGEGAGAGAQASAEEVMKMLQDGNSGRPLSIAQLAIINDAMKRMDYVVQLQRKMSETGQGGSSSLSGGGTGASLATGGSLSVVRVSGAAGRYRAVLTNGQEQTLVKEGDMVGSGRVTSITLSGVRILSDTGSTLIPFASSYGQSGVSTSR